MRQARLMSFAEALANVMLGFLVGLLAQVIAFPMVGLQASPSQSLRIALVFLGLSLARSYAVRRLFEGLRWRRS